MKVTVCTDRPLLVPCGLDDFDFQIDPYVGCAHLCHYCYVLDQAETDWREEIRVHADLADRLAAELDGLPPQRIYLGYHTDPYQPVEAEHRQTRRVLELLAERGFSASLLTKSDLVLRDRDVLGRMPDANVAVSVAFLDDGVRALFEADTIGTRRRIDALRTLREEGLGTSALVCPVIPHVTPARALVEALAPHARTIRVYALSVAEPTQRGWLNVRDLLARHYPERRVEIEAAVMDRDHPYWDGLRRNLRDLAETGGIDLRIHL